MIPNKYSPSEIEEKWYTYWLNKNLFEPTGKGTPFAVPIPPPNVTGVLHIGHCLNNSIQDVFVRYKRMKGFDALWIPGLDHAGISTQQKVMQKLEKEGKDLKKVSKDEFLSEAWAWKEKYGNTILDQYKKLGLSLAWSKTTFTLDPKYAEAVKTFFINLYKDNLIYRGEYLVNWSREFQTALSDDEVEHRLIKRKIWDIAYKTTDGDEIVVSSTRPETMLGDSAVAVNPKDNRYKHLVGKTAIIPIINREIPIIADDYVKIDFGTGALKVTPSNDINDFQIGKRHQLEIINIFDKDLNIVIDPYKGLSTEETQKQILIDLDKLGSIRKVSDIESSVGFCSKSGKQIETVLSTQWFVKMRPLAQKALDAVKTKQIEILPHYWVKTYNHWLENIEDWCISRQLWWGHPIPVSYEGSKIHLDSDKYIPEKDVLDTWFSSALWPLATLGWPEKTKELDRYFPTDIVVTGGDIIFFWIARMIIASFYCLDKIPFKKVLFHGIVRDEQGRKMSKSLGNSPDPLDIIKKYGADALRFALIYNNNMGTDLHYSESWVEMGRNVCNKLWNIYRFIEMNKDEGYVVKKIDLTKLDYFDKWIISNLEKSIKIVEDNIEAGSLDIAIKEIYTLFWNNFADWYIELVKADLKTEKYKIDVLYYVFNNILKLMHPFIPFITEEIYQNINSTTLVNAEFPEIVFNLEAISLETFKDSVKLVRNIKQEFGIQCKDIEIKLLKGNLDKDKLEKFLNAKINIVESFSEQAILKSSELVEVAVLADGVHLKKEVDRLKSILAKEIESYNKVNIKLSDESFLSKAPKHIIDKERGILEEYKTKIDSINQQLDLLKG